MHSIAHQGLGDVQYLALLLHGGPFPLPEWG